MRARRFGAVGYLAQTLLYLVFGAVVYWGLTSPGSLLSFVDSVPWPQGEAGTLLLEALLVIPLVLVSAGWVLLGMSRESRILEVTGVLGFLNAIGYLGFVAWVYGEAFGPSSIGPPAALSSLITGVMALFALVVLFGIFEIVSLYTAATLCQSRRFGLAAWGRMASIAIVFGIVIYLFQSAISSVGEGTLLGTNFPLGSAWLYPVDFIVLAVPTFLAFRAFQGLPTVESPVAPTPAPPATAV